MDLNTVTPESVGLSSARLNRIGTAVQEHVDRGQQPGLITVVARRGKVAHFECYGMRDVEAGKPMQPDTLLRVCSMTKPITAVALMMLLDEGRFMLDDPVSKWIPAFRDLKVYAGSTEAGVKLADLERPITIRHLLTHTAGLTYGSSQDSPVEGMYREAGLLGPLYMLQVPLPELVRRLAELPLVHQPGTVWQYSISYDVIGYLIGVLSDLPFEVYLQEKVFAPLGMDDTGFYVPQDKLGRFATEYTLTGTGELKVSDPPTATSPYANADVPPSGGGGLVSTAPDYLRFAQMLLNGGVLDGARLLGRKTVEWMTMNHLPDDLLPFRLFGSPWLGAGYGLGFAVVMDAAQRPTLASTGTYEWWSRTATLIWVDPQEDLIGLFMPQGVAWRLGPIFRNLVYQAIID